MLGRPASPQRAAWFRAFSSGIGRAALPAPTVGAQDRVEVKQGLCWCVLPGPKGRAGRSWVMAGMGTRMVPKIARRVAHLGPQPILRLRFPNGGARWVVGGGMGVWAGVFGGWG